MSSLPKGSEHGWLAAGVGAAALGSYAVTLAPSVTFIDSGELAAAAWGFGIAHPTGYPLFTLLAGGLARLPLAATPILRLNLVSALFSAGGAGVLFLLLRRLLPRAAPAPDGRPDAPDARLAAAVGAACIASSRTFWGNALSVEVYALHGLMLALVLLALLDALPAPGERVAGPPRLAVLAFLLGLSFGNHLTTVQALPGIGLVLLTGFGPRRPLGSALLRAAPAFLLGLLPYLYLPLRALAAPAVEWGECASPAGLLRHVLAREHGGRFFLGAEAAAASLGYFARTLPGELGYGAAPFALLGCARTWRGDRRLAAALLLLFASSVAFGVSYSIPDIDSYFLLAYVVAGLWASCGLLESLRWLRRRGSAAAPLLPLAVLAVGFVANGRAVSERGNHLVEDYVQNLFRSLEPRAVLVTYQWEYVVSPALYFQTVAGLRPDVTIVDKRLCARAWYVRRLAARRPELFAGARAELAALLEHAERRERGAAADAPELQRRLDALLGRMIDTTASERPVYLTVDVEESIAPGWAQVPEGLALRLYPPAAVPADGRDPWADFRYRPFPRRDRLTDQVRKLYATMLMGRGVFLERQGKPGPAAACYVRALGFEPPAAVRDEIRRRLAAVGSAP